MQWMSVWDWWPAPHFNCVCKGWMAKSWGARRQKTKAPSEIAYFPKTHSSVIFSREPASTRCWAIQHHYFQDSVKALLISWKFGGRTVIFNLLLLKYYLVNKNIEVGICVKINWNWLWIFAMYTGNQHILGYL